MKAIDIKMLLNVAHCFSSFDKVKSGKSVHLIFLSQIVELHFIVPCLTASLQRNLTKPKE